MADLKKITDMLVAKALDEDDHFFAEVSGKLSEVPLSLLMRTLVRRIDFPKGFVDVSDAYSQSDCQEPIDYLFDLPAGNYILNDMSGEYLNGTYQMSRFDGDGGRNVTRWLIVTTDYTHVELYSSDYSNEDPLLWINGENGELSFKGESIATKIDIDNAIRGIGITVVKESPESAELGANTYAASGDRLPVVVPAAQTADHRPVGKGSQIIFVPEHNNIGTDPMLTLNDGVAVPIRQRAAIDTQTADNTVQISANTLIQGMPYTLTFCGVAWLIDSYLPGEGAETTATVTSVNNKTGAVTITADDLGAALAVANWKVATKAFLRLIQNEQYEDLTPQQYLWTRKQGCYFIRYTDGVHVLVRVDLGSEETDQETGVTARTGPVIRLYANIPESDGESTISGGLWIGETQLAAITSLTDLTAISLLLNNSPLITQQELLSRLNGYVTNTGLALTLGSYSTTQQVQALINAALGNFNSIFYAVYGTTTFDEVKTAYEAGKYIVVKKSYGSAGAFIYAPLVEVDKIGNNISAFKFCGVNLLETAISGLFDPPRHTYANGFVSVSSSGAWNFYTEPANAEIVLTYESATLTDVREFLQKGFDVVIEMSEGMFWKQKRRLKYCASETAWGGLMSPSIFVFSGITPTQMMQTSYDDNGNETTTQNEPTAMLEIVWFDADGKHYKADEVNSATAEGSMESPIDLTAEFAEWLDENSTGTPDMFFMTVTDVGVYTMSDSTGLWHCCRVIRASDGDDAELYRLIYSLGTAEAAASIRLLNAEHPTPLVCDNKVNFTSGISVPTPVGAWDATPMSYVDALRASHRAMIVARPTTAQARQIADEAVAARLPLGEMSTVSTRLEKCSMDRVRYIRVDLMNNEFLRSLHEAGDHISLHFLMCSRKRGSGHHWWHPSNYDHEPTGNEPFRLGYASMAGKRVNDFDQTVFPPVPDWMPGDGWMQTELTIGADDLNRGYVLIDPATYFLPMVKPSVYGQDGNWGENISVVSTRRQDAGNMSRKMPIVCTWQVAVNGVEIGRPLDVLRVGCSRNSNSYNTTTLQIVDGNARVVKLYTSVSR